VTQNVEYTTFKQAEKSDWVCYMYGSKPNGQGMVYYPNKGNVPNWFVRYMMKVCLGCTWVKGSWS
jgi:hypothetical protein